MGLECVDRRLAVSIKVGSRDNGDVRGQERDVGMRYASIDLLLSMTQ